MQLKFLLNMPLAIKGNLDNYLSNLFEVNKSSKTKINSVYGAIPSNDLGSGRPYLGIGEISIPNFFDIAKRIQDNNISFCYALNAPSFGGNEGKPSFIAKVDKLIKMLLKNKINEVTLANPFLIFHISKEFPEINITISSYCFVESLEETSFYASIKTVKKIILGQNAMLKMNLVNEMNKYLVDNDKILELMLDVDCLINCPLRYFHSLTSGYLNKNNRNNSAINFIQGICYLQKTYTDRERTIIAPSSLKKYIDVGINYFKMNGRHLASEVVIQNLYKYIKEFDAIC